MDIVSRQYALTNKLTRYYTGKPCKHNHTSERKVSNRSCVKCENILKARRQRVRYTTDPAFKERKKQYDIERHTYRAANEVGYKEAEYARLVTWRKENPAKANELVASRRATKVEWADTAKISEVYEEATRLTELHGEPYEVDHIIPIKGLNVCGLHVHENLRAIPRNINRAKSNKFKENENG